MICVRSLLWMLLKRNWKWGVKMAKRVNEIHKYQKMVKKNQLKFHVIHRILWQYKRRRQNTACGTGSQRIIYVWNSWWDSKYNRNGKSKLWTISSVWFECWNNKKWNNKTVEFPTKKMQSWVNRKYVTKVFELKIKTNAIFSLFLFCGKTVPHPMRVCIKKMFAACNSKCVVRHAGMRFTIRVHKKVRIVCDHRRRMLCT